MFDPDYDRHPNDVHGEFVVVATFYEPCWFRSLPGHKQKCLARVSHIPASHRKTTEKFQLRLFEEPFQFWNSFIFCVVVIPSWMVSWHQYSP